MTLAKLKAEAAAAALASLLVAATGCGTPGPPQPPSLNLPDRVDNLTAVRAGSQVTLTWTMPKRNTDRLPLKTNVAVRVCRGEATSPCTPIAKLSFAPSSEGTFTESLPQPLASGSPRPLSYYVVLENRIGRSAGESNAAVVLAGEAPGPVAALAAEVRKAGIVLRWTAGNSHDAIRIHRRLLSPQAPASHSGPPSPPSEPLEQDLLVDSDTGVALDQGTAFGKSYEYRAQRIAMITIDGREVELAGGVSAPIQIEAQDVFPPAVPKGLAAVATAAAPNSPASIDLNWEPNTEADLAGYFVYRREEATTWTRVSGGQLLVGPAFHDANVLPGHTYRYAVSAVDRSGHESGHSGEAQETVPKP